MTSPDPNAQGGTGPAQSGETETGQGTGTETGQGNENGTQSGTGSSQTQPEATVSRAEFEQLRNQLRTADQKRSDAEKALKDLVEKDLPEQEKLKSQLAEAQAASEKANEELKKRSLENAFLKENKYKWKNPAAAMKLADLSKVEVDEDGTVHNLIPALDALAKSDPYLLEDKETEDENNKPKGSTGAPGTGGRDGKPVGITHMVSRLPALRTRGIGPNDKH